ncbi:hypothetical protein P5673_018147 [Acropora cervicornis]|uniref:Uncharacterized protein n=1 Tax=Acropora cervicornis TaxID=6130 RepID=A0AAD9V357_ACRCE|nr:hypothetical protein P5673_018147 [Acropora cervicornis]
MADEEGFDIGRDLLVFLASLLDKTEYICQNDEGGDTVGLPQYDDCGEICDLLIEK